MSNDKDKTRSPDKSTVAGMTSAGFDERVRDGLTAIDFAA